VTSGSPKHPQRGPALAAAALGLLSWCALPRIDPAEARGLASPTPGWLAARVVTLKAPEPTMIRVPAGSFVMGSSLKAIMSAAELCQRQAPSEVCRPRTFADEQPLHTVELTSFWLDSTEVTVADYERCVEQRRCAAPPYAEGALRFYQPNYPVSLVTWEDAQGFCHWRGARLPTEAEFERASRGASGREFPWGNLYNSRLSNHGRYGVADTDASDGFEELAPVASYPEGRTPDGFLDLAGNVAEWVFDRYGPTYPEQTLQNPEGPSASSSNVHRVVRGGHYKSAPVWLRGTARDSQTPGQRLPQLGFRCARGAPMKSPTP